VAGLLIRKRGKVYQYQFEIAPQRGKRQWVTKSGFKTKAAAEEAGTKARTEYLNAGLPFKESVISYGDYLDYWLNNYCKVNLKYSTTQTYKSIIDKYIRPELGRYRLTSITSVKLNTFITETCEKYTYSRAYFKTILKVLKGTFRDACDIYGFIKYNPAITIRLPRLDIEPKEAKHLYTQEEIDLILERFQNNPIFTCAFLTACFTGLRTGEVCALTWDDIDLENRIIYVNHNVYDKPKDEKGRWYIGPPKTTSGKRAVYICDTLLIALTNYKQLQKDYRELFGSEYIYYHLEDVVNEYGKVKEQRIVKNETNDQKIFDLVFTKYNGVYTGTDFIRYPFDIIHRELGIEKCRFYDLRGSYATKILNNGVEIRDVADILGHRNIETTENYYISSTAASRMSANNSFEEITKSETINKIINYKL